jgi:transposase
MVIERRPVSQRLAFAKAVVAGTPKRKVMRTLDIAESTYYKWKACMKRQGKGWVNGKQNTRAKRVAGATAEATQEGICELSLEYPTMPLRTLAVLIDISTTPRLMISKSTVQSILKKRGLSTRSQRAAELRTRLLGKKSLSPAQRQLVEEFHPVVRWKDPIGRWAGEILTQDTVNMHHAGPVGRADISIIVDTFNGAAFAKFPDRGATTCLEVDCASESIGEHLRMGRKVRTIYTDAGHEFGNLHRGHVYNKLLAEHKIAHRLADQQGTKRNPFVQVVWADLRKFLFGGGIHNPASYRGRLDELNPEIRDFLNNRYFESLSAISGGCYPSATPSNR